MTNDARRRAIAGAFRQQARDSENLGSPLTAALLAGFAEDIAAAGTTWRLVSGFDGDLVAAALALRVAGAAHRYALDAHDGTGGALARFYPSAGGAFDAQRDGTALTQAALAALDADPGHFRAYLEGPPQTNEVGRAGVLIGGFLTIAKETGLPLSLFEIGASAGLNLCFDRFRYKLGTAEWGPADAPVQLAPEWRGGAPPADAALAVAGRAGCDIAPVDVNDVEARRRLEAYVWADQTERLARLRGAISVALEQGVAVEKASADDWAARVLAALTPGVATVIFHTVMWQYLPQEVQASIEASLAQAGARATRDAPLARLAMEPGEDPTRPMELGLTQWPGGERRTLARVHPHGAIVRWLS